MEDHRSNLSKICRICFKLLGKKGFSTKKFHDIISKAFFINTTTDDKYIHPTKICQKCYLQASMAVKRNTTTSIDPFNNWNAHFDDNCQICDTVKLLSKGVIGLQKIHKSHKKHPGGRPTSEKLWNQSVLNKLNQSIPLDSIHPNIRIGDLDEHTNTHISLCKCGLCADVLRRPVTISACEHIFCFSCFAKYIKSKLESESFCPTCNINFKIDNIKFSQHQKKLLDLLKVSCNLRSKKFRINSDYELYIQHKSKCCENPMDQPNKSLTEIFKLTDDSEIPRDIEDATLHVIKKKIAKSNNNSIEFKSGGPWVRFFHCFETEHPINFFPCSLYCPKKVSENQGFSNFLRGAEKR